MLEGKLTKPKSANGVSNEKLIPVAANLLIKYICEDFQSQEEWLEDMKSQFEVEPSIRDKLSGIHDLDKDVTKPATKLVYEALKKIKF